MSVENRSEVTLQTDTPAQAPQQGTGEAQGDSASTGTYGGFNTVEELVAAYEAAKAPKQDEGGTQGDSQGDKGGDDANADDTVSDVLKSAGLDQDEFTNEFAENGELSEKSYEKLAKAGFPKEMVDIYVEGLKSSQNAYNAAVFAPAGGEQGYTALVEWAKSNASADEKRAFNEAVSSGDPTRAAMAVQGLMAKKGGSRGSFLNGKTGAGAGPDIQPFQSLQQVTAAKRDPRYRTDPAYRAEVSARLRASSIVQ